MTRQGEKTTPAKQTFLSVDSLGFLLLFILFAAYVYYVSDTSVFGEPDLYHMALGLLSGHTNGLGIFDPLHYGPSFCFGYLKAIYWLADDSILRDFLKITQLMNRIGYISALFCVLFMWIALRRAYGATSAISTLMLVAFCPIFIEVSTSGHPILPAYACFFLSACLFLAEGSGWKKHAAIALAAFFLVISLTLRADVVFLLPWLATVHKNPATFSTFVKKTAIRTAIILLCFLIFSLLKHYVFLVENPSTGAQRVEIHTLSEWLAEFFNTKKIFGGTVSLILGVGIINVFLGLTALAVSAKKFLPLNKLHLRPETLQLIGPLAMMALDYAFWAPVGQNSRHFLPYALGTSLLLVLLAKNFLFFSQTKIIILSLVILAGNELTAELARPIILSKFNSPYTSFPDKRRTFMLTPLGYTALHVKTLQERWNSHKIWSHTLKDLCDTKVIVLTDSDSLNESASTLFTKDHRPTTTLFVKHGLKHAVDAKLDSKQILFIEKNNFWPKDPLAELLNDPEFADYKIILNPYEMSIYDKTPLPTNRAAAIGCKNE